VTEITEKVRANFPVGIILAFGVFIGGAVWQAAELHHTISDRFKEINARLVSLDNKIVGKGPNGWHYQQMNLWCLQFRTANPGVHCPDPREIIDQTYSP